MSRRERNRRRGRKRHAARPAFLALGVLASALTACGAAGLLLAATGAGGAAIATVGGVVPGFVLLAGSGLAATSGGRVAQAA